MSMAPKTIRDTLLDAERRFQQVGIESARAEAEAIVCYAQGITRAKLFLQDEIDNESKIESMITKRMRRVPLQHILGTMQFRFLSYDVGPGVFIPRPETEVMMESIIDCVRKNNATVVVDLCSGSGVMGISLATECKNINVHAVEMSDDAITWCKKNIEIHKDEIAQQKSSVNVIQADITADSFCDHLTSTIGKADVIMCNPPYVPEGSVDIPIEVEKHDPPIALYAGDKGLDVIQVVVPTVTKTLKPGGFVFIEHGDDQACDVMELFIEEDWENVSGYNDLNGRPRFVSAQKKR